MRGDPHSVVRDLAPTAHNTTVRSVAQCSEVAYETRLADCPP